MPHGTQGFFLERTRCSRRTALTTLAVALALCGSLAAMRVPGMRERLDLLRLRFGFEGPEQFVRRVMLDTEPRLPLQTRNGLAFRTRASERGGSPEPARSHAPQAQPETRLLRIGPGVSEEDLMAHARALHRNNAVFRSEELVLEKLVHPIYPEDAREKGIEGPVVLLAHVDENGAVIGVEVMGSSGEPPLERAATTAVWQCRFRPFMTDGRAREVYAVFHFRFSLY